MSEVHFTVIPNRKVSTCEKHYSVFRILLYYQAG